MGTSLLVFNYHGFTTAFGCKGKLEVARRIVDQPAHFRATQLP